MNKEWFLAGVAVGLAIGTIASWVLLSYLPYVQP